MTPTDLLTPEDRHNIAARGMTLATVVQQLDWFQSGFPFVRLQRPCTVEDGIVRFSPQEIEQFSTLHDQAAHAGRVLKFVPASGAASRMFQSLLNLANRTEPLTPAAIATAADSGDVDCQQFRQLLANIEHFAFAADLRTVLARDGHTLDGIISDGRYRELLAYLLTPQGLDYANLPKGLIQFHRYTDHSRTAFEEHLAEAAVYAQDGTRTAHVHFTVSAEHRAAIAAYLQKVLPRYEQAGCHYDLTFSVQKPASDTIAVDAHNQPFRDAHGELVFRPGGHGALLENLHDLRGDLIFIKNIDNVVPDHRKAETYRYKKALCGYLVALQNDLFQHQHQLRQESATPAAIVDTMQFAQQKLFLHLPEEVRHGGPAMQRRFLLQKLHRPLRVCGVVKNTGEPGGGPFWVQGQDGSASLQLVESSQVHMQAAEQRAMWQAATHFNPVDLVCGVRDFAGKSFDLHQFTDPRTGFISSKSKDGKELRALELPGLWNGAMAAWHTIFVEVPLSTFNPVKTVYDLLRPEHRDA